MPKNELHAERQVPTSEDVLLSGAESARGPGSPPDRPLAEQRFLTIGELAAGIAHEISTPIQYTSDSLYFLQLSCDAILPVLRACRRLAEMPAADPDAALIAEIRSLAAQAELDDFIDELVPAVERGTTGVQRVTELVRALQAVARAAESPSADLRRIVKDVVTVARNEYKYVADVEVDFESLAFVPLSAAATGQLVLALVLMAADAVARATGDTGGRGCILISGSGAADVTALIVEVRCAGVAAAWQPLLCPGSPARRHERLLADAAGILAGGRGELRIQPKGADVLALVAQLPSTAREHVS